jgi:tryptophan synthase beta chain
MGIFTGFISDPVDLWGVEPLGRGTGQLGDHAASLRFGQPGLIHGFTTMTLADDDGNPAAVHSVASGLDYPGVGPEHAYLFSEGRTRLAGATDAEAVAAFYRLSRLEGIIPALESAHALAYAAELAKANPNDSILVNLSGRGDKDMDFVYETYPPETWAK